MGRGCAGVCRVSCCSASLDGLGLLAHVLPSPQLLQKRNAKECNEFLKSYLYLWVRECKPPEASFLCVSSIFKRRQGVTSCLSVFHSGQCNCIRNGAERPLEPPQPDSLVCVCHCSPAPRQHAKVQPLSPCAIRLAFLTQHGGRFR